MTTACSVQLDLWRDVADQRDRAAFAHTTMAVAMGSVAPTASSAASAPRPPVACRDLCRDIAVLRIEDFIRAQLAGQLELGIVDVDGEDASEARRPWPPESATGRSCRCR